MKDISSLNRRFATPPLASLRSAPVPPLNVPRVAVVPGRNVFHFQWQRSEEKDATGLQSELFAIFGI